jgi:hypothetical protein
MLNSMIFVFKMSIRSPSILVVVILLDFHVWVKATSDCEDAFAEGEKTGAETIILCSAQ